MHERREIDTGINDVDPSRREFLKTQERVAYRSTDHQCPPDGEPVQKASTFRLEHSEHPSASRDPVARNGVLLPAEIHGAVAQRDEIEPTTLVSEPPLRADNDIGRVPFELPLPRLSRDLSKGFCREICERRACVLPMLGEQTLTHLEYDHASASPYQGAGQFQRVPLGTAKLAMPSCEDQHDDATTALERIRMIAHWTP